MKQRRISNRQNLFCATGVNSNQYVLLGETREKTSNLIWENFEKKNLNIGKIILHDEIKNKILSCDIYGNNYFYRKHILARGWKQLSIYAVACFSDSHLHCRHILDSFGLSTYEFLECKYL